MAREKGDSSLQGWAEHPELRLREIGKYECLDNFVPVLFGLFFGYNVSLVFAPCGPQGIVQHQGKSGNPALIMASATPADDVPHRST